VARRTAGVVTLAALVLVLLALAVGLRILRPVSCPDQPEWWMVGC
jgi:regulator of sirC expression with transglutaminase-like and TPR domain